MFNEKSIDTREPRFAYTIAEFAELTTFSVATVYRRRNEGKLKISKSGGRSVILKEDAEIFLKNLRS